MSRILSLWLLIQDLYPALSILAMGALKVSVAFLVVSGLSQWSRRRSALVRSWFWRVGICGMLAILGWALAPQFIPGLRLPFLFKVDALVLPADISEAAEYATKSGGQSTPWAVQPQASRAQFLALDVGVELPPWVHPQDDEYLKLKMRQPVLGKVDQLCLSFWLWGALILGAWKVMRVACGLVWLRKHGSAVDEELRRLVELEARKLQMTHTPVCRIVPGLGSPLLTGAFGSVIWLPESSATWPRQTVQFAIQHELAHSQRRDGIWQWVAHLTACAWWWHPLAWRALKHLKSEAEFAADELVARQADREPDYAQALLEIARSASGAARPTAGVAMLGMSEIGRRVMAILEANAWKGHLHTGGKWIAWVALCSLIVSAGLGTRPAVAVGGRWVTSPGIPLSERERLLAQTALDALQAKHERLRHVNLEMEYMEGPKPHPGVAMKWPNITPKVLRRRATMTLDTWTGARTITRTDLVEETPKAGAEKSNLPAPSVWVAVDEAAGWPEDPWRKGPDLILGFHHEYEVMRNLKLLLNSGKPNWDTALPPYLLQLSTRNGQQALVLSIIRSGERPFDDGTYTRYVVDLERGILMEVEKNQRAQQRGEEILKWELLEPAQNADGIWYPRRYRWGNRWQEENVEVTRFVGTRGR